MSISSAGRLTLLSVILLSLIGNLIRRGGAVRVKRRGVYIPSPLPRRGPACLAWAMGFCRCRGILPRPDAASTRNSKRRFAYGAEGRQTLALCCQEIFYLSSPAF